MVDVGDKEITAREAIAGGLITLSPEAFAAITEGRIKKGDVLAVAQLAGIAAAQRTPELVPLCHPMQLTGVKVMLTPEPPDRVRVWARVRCHWRTGVEMEALTAATAALLTVYDMVKAIDRWMSIEAVELLEKRGGKSGDLRRPGVERGPDSA
mgnify:CR=1 FL=1